MKFVKFVWVCNATLLTNNANTQENIVVLVHCESRELCENIIVEYQMINQVRLKTNFAPLSVNTYIQRHGDPEGLREAIAKLSQENRVILFHPKQYQQVAEVKPCLVRTALTVRQKDDKGNNILLSGTPDVIKARLWQENSRCYVVIHAVKSFWFPSDFQHDLRSACLYEGKAAEDYENSAPYLVELPLEHNFTKKLFTEDPPSNGAHFNHWGKNVGIFFRSKASIDEILAHFRRFIYMPTYDERLLYFRFYDPVVLANYLDIITCYPKKLATFFDGNLIDAFAVCDADHFIDFIPNIDLSKQEKAKKQFDGFEMQMFIDQRDNKLLQQVTENLIGDFPKLSENYGNEAIHKIVRRNFELAKRHKMVLTGSIYLLASYQLVLGKPIDKIDKKQIFLEILNSHETEKVKVYRIKEQILALHQKADDTAHGKL